MYKLFLTLRYLHKRRIAFFAIVGVWLCVAMVVVVISVMGGFLDTLKEKSRGLLSDIVVDNATLQGFPFYEQFTAHLKQHMPDLVEAATPAIYNYGILRVERTSFTKPVRVVGIDLPGYKAVNDFQNSLFYDKYYPGTTHLGLQQQPVYGYEENLNPILPEDHQRALSRYAEAHPEDPELTARRRGPFGSSPFPGEFRSIDSLIAEQSRSVREPGHGVPDDIGPRYQGPDAPGIIVGCNIINDRSPSGDLVRVTPRGAKLILMVVPLTPGGRISGEGTTTVITRLADDSRTGVFEIDDMCCYVDFELAQGWLRMGSEELEVGGRTPKRTSQLLIALADGVDLQEARAAIQLEWQSFLDALDVSVSPMDRQLLSFVTVETWEERQKRFIAALEKEKILMAILFALMSLVTVILIACIFWMIVTQKTRDIGIVKSLGGSPRGVVAIFVSFGAAVGVVGAVLGVATGAVFVWYINDVQDALVAVHPDLRVWSPDVYTFDRIPNVVKLHEVTIIAFVAVIAAMAGSLIPAFIAGRVWPVRALRYE